MNLKMSSDPTTDDDVFDDNDDVFDDNDDDDDYLVK